MEKEIKNEEKVTKTAIKKLTKAELQKQNKQLDEQREFTVAIGETEYKLTHDVIFRKSKQHALLDDLLAFFDEGAKNIEILQLGTPYVTLLVLKHFTSLEVSDEIEEALDLLQVLIDLEIFDKILNELPDEQLTTIYELVSTTVDNLRENLVSLEKEIREEEEQKNKELIEDGDKQ